MSTYSEIMARATPPEILFAEDLATLLGVTTAEADWEARTGRLGPAFYVRGRVAVLREDLLNLLRFRSGAAGEESREVLP
jgi:hypothetical protein